MRLSLIQGLVRISTQCRLFDDQPRHIWRPAQLGEVSKGASCLLDWEAKKGRIWKQISDARRDLRTDDGYPRVWMFCVPALSGLVLHQLASLYWAGCPVNRMNCYEPLFKAEWLMRTSFQSRINWCSLDWVLSSSQCSAFIFSPLGKDLIPSVAWHRLRKWSFKQASVEYFILSTTSTF